MLTDSPFLSVICSNPTAMRPRSVSKRQIRDVAVGAWWRTILATVAARSAGGRVIQRRSRYSWTGCGSTTPQW
jgi:hypothetical protein